VLGAQAGCVQGKRRHKYNGRVTSDRSGRYRGIV